MNNELIDLAKRPRCMERWGFGRVPGLILCEKCVDRLSSHLLQINLEQNLRFRQWWHQRQSKNLFNFKTGREDADPAPRKRCQKKESEVLMETLLKILAESDRPLSARELKDLAQAARPDRHWTEIKAVNTALKAAFDAGLVSRCGETGEGGNGRRYLYSFIRQEEQQSA